MICYQSLYSKKIYIYLINQSEILFIFMRYDLYAYILKKWNIIIQIKAE